MTPGSVPSAMFVALVLISPTAYGASEVDELKARVAALEERLSSLEKTLQPLVAKAQAEQSAATQQSRARERMQQDRTNFTQDQLREIESLYQVANKQWGTPEALKSLQALVEKYDKANRTGCAFLYLGQMSSDDEKKEHLQKAIDEFGDCFYGDGVQVGAYARYLLGQLHLENNPPAEAKKMFDEIRDQYPDAIDHRGNSLVGMLPRQVTSSGLPNRTLE